MSIVLLRAVILYLHPSRHPTLGDRTRYMLGLNGEGQPEVFGTTNDLLAPRPAFLDEAKYWAALTSGHCTHAEVRSVLQAALNEAQHPGYSQAIRDCLGSGYCHLIVDEAFDMNPVDILMVDRAIEAGVTVTIIGDPWQSLYDFRGARPREVQHLLSRHGFIVVPMPGAHRYQTSEMRSLATRLFDELPFTVLEAVNGESFEVVLAHDWAALWAEGRIPVLPAGKASKIDNGSMAACFVLLLNEVVHDFFDLEASGVGEARRLLRVDQVSDRMVDVLGLLGVDPV